ncbi:hypothetical protein PINS_up018723 [Pythium insidiosum]|nr:hypothetical protein PINS_up018723 [Pythium insidiosum]
MQDPRSEMIWHSVFLFGGVPVTPAMSLSVLPLSSTSTSTSTSAMAVRRRAGDREKQAETNIKTKTKTNTNTKTKTAHATSGSDEKPKSKFWTKLWTKLTGKNRDEKKTKTKTETKKETENVHTTENNAVPHCADHTPQGCTLQPQAKPQPQPQPQCKLLESDALSRTEPEQRHKARSLFQKLVKSKCKAPSKANASSSGTDGPHASGSTDRQPSEVPSAPSSDSTALGDTADANRDSNTIDVVDVFSDDDETTTTAATGQ